MAVSDLDPDVALVVIDLQNGIVALHAPANAIARMFPRLGETGTTREIVALVDRDDR